MRDLWISPMTRPAYLSMTVAEVLDPFRHSDELIVTKMAKVAFRKLLGISTNSILAPAWHQRKTRVMISLQEEMRSPWHQLRRHPPAQLCELLQLQNPRLLP